jgi:hypothetical protein
MFDLTELTRIKSDIDRVRKEIAKHKWTMFRLAGELSELEERRDALLDTISIGADACGQDGNR